MAGFPIAFKITEKGSRSNSPEKAIYHLSGGRREHKTAEPNNEGMGQYCKLLIFGKNETFIFRHTENWKIERHKLEHLALSLGAVSDISMSGFKPIPVASPSSTLIMKGVSIGAKDQ